MAPFETKILPRAAVRDFVSGLARPLVFTNGVFDVLHRGHVTYLAQARALGAVLVVGVNSDTSARRLGKGADRPINCDADRAALLAALSAVDVVTIFEEDTPCELIELLRPDIFVKGGDYDIDRLREAELVRSWGGTAQAIPFLFERSTSETLRRIRGLRDHANSSAR
jgi:rfaE bifunctional protein nucleotidyltransferase chain/domain